MRKTALLLLVLVSFLSASVQAEILPVSKIQKGMRGYGLTVFEGSKVEKFDVEILGVLRKIGPDQDLILVKVDSDLVRSTGIIAGMSGSPIYVDGKVIGALAYAWQFSKEPIAAITPIEEMLRIDKNGRGSARAAATRMSTPDFLAAIQNPTEEHLSKLFAAVAPSRGFGAMGALPIALPVSFSGFSGDTVNRFSPLLEASGFLAVPAGTAAPAKHEDAVIRSFQPGDPIGAVLIDGDFSVAATGTVTYVDQGQVYGFGHPFLDLGEIDFPMAQSEVVAIMPSLARSFKFANTGAIIGALRQDRGAGIFGRLGEDAGLIPVQLSIDDGAQGNKTYNFGVVRNSLLFPLMVAMVADNVVTTAQRGAGERTLRLEAEINLEGREPIRIRDGWAGVGARQAIPTYLALVMNYLISNEFSDAQIKSLKVNLRHDDDLKVAKLLEAAVETPKDGTVSPGDTVKLRALLKPYRGEAFVETFEIQVPTNQKLGTANLFVGSGSIANQLNFSLIPPDPRNFTQVVAVLERLRSATDLTVGMYFPSEGAVNAGVFMPDLPPSIQAVIAADTSHSGQIAVKYHAPDQIVRPLEYIVDGALKVEVPIRQRL